MRHTPNARYSTALLATALAVYDAPSTGTKHIEARARLGDVLVAIHGGPFMFRGALDPSAPPYPRPVADPIVAQVEALVDELAGPAEAYASGPALFIVQGLHHIVPGVPMSAHFTRASADQAAADLVNMILVDLTEEAGHFDENTDGPKPSKVTAANWEEAAEWLSRLNESGDGTACDVWLTEVTPPDAPAFAPGTEYLDRFPAEHRATADRAYQDGFADGAGSVQHEAASVLDAGIAVSVVVGQVLYVANRFDVYFRNQGQTALDIDDTCTVLEKRFDASGVSLKVQFDIPAAEGMDNLPDVAVVWFGDAKDDAEKYPLSDLKLSEA